MDMFDVAIVGAGPAGATCAAHCAAAGLRTIVIEREKFPREKVCGDCLNPGCWPLLQELQLSERVRTLPHAKLEKVNFVAIGGANIEIDLPGDQNGEIALKRSLFDDLLCHRARELGAQVRDSTIVSTVQKMRRGDWKLDIVRDQIMAHFLVAADGRNSTIARLRNLLPRPQRERVALQSHIPRPRTFGNRVVLQLLREGYSGQAPVSDTELNVCLVATPHSIARLKVWAEGHFGVSSTHSWRTITPLTRAPITAAHQNLFFIGDAARVVEPFTGEGIYYALSSGRLAAKAIIEIARGQDQPTVLRQFLRDHAEMYRGRLWINQAARAAVLSPRFASFVLKAVRLNPGLLNLLTQRIVSAKTSSQATVTTLPNDA